MNELNIVMYHKSGSINYLISKEDLIQTKLIGIIYCELKSLESVEPWSSLSITEIVILLNLSSRLLNKILPLVSRS